jgi:hypothetical protein
LRRTFIHTPSTACPDHTTRTPNHPTQIKPKFYEAFSGDGYPEAFKYRQRVVLLFQKIDGVDVALYCMCVVGWALWMLLHAPASWPAAPRLAISNSLITNIV